MTVTKKILRRRMQASGSGGDGTSAAQHLQSILCGLCAAAATPADRGGWEAESARPSVTGAALWAQQGKTSCGRRSTCYFIAAVKNNSVLTRPWWQACCDECCLRRPLLDKQRARVAQY